MVDKRSAANKKQVNYHTNKLITDEQEIDWLMQRCEELKEHLRKAYQQEINTILLSTYERAIDKTQKKIGELVQKQLLSQLTPLAVNVIQDRNPVLEEQTAKALFGLS